MTRIFVLSVFRDELKRVEASFFRSGGTYNNLFILLHIFTVAAGNKHKSFIGYTRFL